MPSNDTSSLHSKKFVSYIKIFENLKLDEKLFTNLEYEIKEKIFLLIEKLKDMFKGPFLIIKKRDDKLLDYDRAKLIKSRGEELDKSLKESCEVYELLNSQLIEELPKFFNLTAKFLKLIESEIIKNFTKFYEQVSTSLEKFAEEIYNLKKSDLQNFDTVREKFFFNFKEGSELEICSRNILLLKKWRILIWLEEEFTLKGGFLSNIDYSFHAPDKNKNDPFEAESSIKGTVLYDFKGEYEDEVNIYKGDMIEIILETENNKREGWSLIFFENSVG
ncbi:hypothetical protein HK099_000104, partial [Clydaea vesicula]